MAALKRRALAGAAAVLAPICIQSPAQAGGGIDYQGGFAGKVDSAGGVDYFETVRCDSDGLSVGIAVDSFTSPDNRLMVFQPLNSYNWNYQIGGGTAYVSEGDSSNMALGNHCWRFAINVTPGRDTNGFLSPGYGNTSFDGQLKF
ncbi:hypothetical protein KSP35_06300 [Aquihabitans sp. G128]|uniref:hypothetical protein n=1 Tax=Aquihabitans sp. G128 TaxID=2849779 RepID=UPI001C23CA2C|nr:hypothetical protein [Aquihabitans sp. G128]QXC62408.1 hypothetical protein KSP35_06300 [Aquihabitans sp. G128]